MHLSSKFTALVIFIWQPAAACVERYMDCDPVRDESPVGFLEGVLALAGILILVGAYKGLEKTFRVSEGWLKVVPILLVAGLFMVNTLSKSLGSERPIHILILASYIILSIVVCLKIVKNSSVNNS